MTIEIRTGIDMPLHDSVTRESPPQASGGVGATTLERDSVATPDGACDGSPDRWTNASPDAGHADTRHGTPRILVEHAERNAAYVAGRMAVAAVRDATFLWAPDVARTVQRAAAEALAAVIDALAHDPRSPHRRRDLRRAMVSALELVIAFDIAISHGLATSEVDAALRASTRLLSMLGLGLHATVACGE